MTPQTPLADEQSQSFYQRKLYALLQVLAHVPDPSNFSCLETCSHDLETWWGEYGNQITAIAKASDHLAFQANKDNKANQPDQIEVRHLISGQPQTVSGKQHGVKIPNEILNNPNSQIVLLWLWRFHPELQVAQQQDALLLPSEPFMPDCPQHSYASTVSALTGAMFPKRWQPSKETEGPYNPQPYLLLFTFSPVQEFIKASRKFLDFWAGSYLLHYLSADLCWFIAKEYGADAVITPSLWGQEIIDAFILTKHSDWNKYFTQFQRDTDPLGRFNNRTSTSLSTAGFPNVITLLAGSKEQALAIGEALTQRLNQEWQEIAENVREHIKKRVSQTIPEAFQQLNIEEIERISVKQLNDYLCAQGNESAEPEIQEGGLSRSIRSFWQQLEMQLPNTEDPAPYLREMKHYKQGGCWEWNKLWEAQIEQSWEPYYVVVPLGHPDETNPLQIATGAANLENWLLAQNDIVRARRNIAGHYLFPSNAEKTAYPSLNVGTWWGSYQARLGQLIQSVKNTRNWKIPIAPGERSSLSGQYSAVHPRFHYEKFQNGRGMSAGSMRLFWRVMAEAYPGLFNGSEKLNAIELTKRMAWMHGGVAGKLGIKLSEDDEYENLIRFPNLSSIAAARFTSDHPEQVQRYWQHLWNSIRQSSLSKKQNKFYSLTRRPFHVRAADVALKSYEGEARKGYNGMMFSSKWLADDMGLTSEAELFTLRNLIAQTHQQFNFGESSPSDWWVLVLGDGDGMGKYVSGGKLKPYQEYLLANVVDRSQCSTEVQNLPGNVWRDLIQKTNKRMGPATHVGLNRALLDFSNRLVPYLTERRFCGRVIYSGGDDVMVALPLADLPGFLRSLRAAWSGKADPAEEFESRGGYWHPSNLVSDEGIPPRPLFTMGNDATMSLGIVIAHKSVPLPTVLEKLWEAEKERAKRMLGYSDAVTKQTIFPEKDGLCFRVIYSSGNTLEALMKGHLLEGWWEWVSTYKQQTNLSPLLYRLAEVLPQHADATLDTPPLKLVAKVVIESRDEQLPELVKQTLLDWLTEWETWARAAQQTQQDRLKKAEDISDKEAADKAKQTLGTRPEDLSNLLRFTAFWISRRQEEQSWKLSSTVAIKGEA